MTSLKKLQDLMRGNVASISNTRTANGIIKVDISCTIGVYRLIFDKYTAVVQDISFGKPEETNDVSDPEYIDSFLMFLEKEVVPPLLRRNLGDGPGKCTKCGIELLVRRSSGLCFICEGL